MCEFWGRPFAEPVVLVLIGSIALHSRHYQQDPGVDIEILLLIEQLAYFQI